MAPLIALAWVTLAVPCHAIDGDTIKCGTERIRLLGIDAPEMPGHCRRGRVCVEGDPYASKDALAAMLKGKVRIDRVGYDHYGRTLALVEAGGHNIACMALEEGIATYKAWYDNEGRIRQACKRSSARQ
ncbi:MULTISPECIES: thermonuclease family protein [Sphingomonas]|jgi:micrococcal nuclease|uniref:Nuclease n=1 Tax=Sphingomonas melonis TY TaxID=621456 RepID=A0A175Y4Q5_9SPHN|nr:MULTISPECIES: thermonuclease family protein [Sphingomonas]AOW22735.1 nuclease [Sphingomonas melonis TY]ATI56140.1 nuclease [Sphingomonas melonis]KZB95336.1 nuclease [Sphingomonas melonis TY]MBI0530771.1 thermonuclease family protein [Sphingomonas sp. TX0522]MBX8845145.1 thermonuclease family protein [Sphingomonas melonis]